MHLVISLSIDSNIFDIKVFDILCSHNNLLSWQLVSRDLGATNPRLVVNI